MRKKMSNLWEQLGYGGMKLSECWLQLKSTCPPPLPLELTFDLLNSLNLVILRSGFIYGPYTPFGVGVFVSHDV